MKKALKVMALCLLVIFMASCQSKEDKVINKMNALAERIENQTESFTDAEWDAINTEFEALQDAANECSFTSEQKTAYAKAEAEVSAAIVKQRANEAVNDFKDAVEEGKEVFNGILDGVKEGLGIEEEAPAEAE